MSRGQIRREQKKALQRKMCKGTGEKIMIE